MYRQGWYIVGMDTKQKTSFRLSQEAMQILRALAAKHGLTVTGILEMLVREKARAEGLHGA